MNKFTPPQIGSKLGELKLSLNSRISAYFGKPLNEFFRILLFLALVFGPMIYGYDLITLPFNPEWVSVCLGIFLCLLGLFFGYLFLLDFSNDKRKTIELDVKKSYSLFLVKNGVEIGDTQIPFLQKRYFSIENEGIESFKVDGDFLLIKTVGKSYLEIVGNFNENGMKFKIEPKYLSHKEELLAYLNSLIDENQQ
jgi:hypothetical protein